MCEQHTASSLRILLGSKGSVAYFFKKETAPAVLIISALSFIKKKTKKRDRSFIYEEMTVITSSEVN